MKIISLEDFIEGRIEENKKLFTTEELMLIKKNKRILTKIYLLGTIDGRDCYKNGL